MKSKLGLIVGGSGALGRAFVHNFRTRGWHILNVDFSKNEDASDNFLLQPNDKI